MYFRYITHTHTHIRSRISHPLNTNSLHTTSLSRTRAPKTQAGPDQTRPDHGDMVIWMKPGKSARSRCKEGLMLLPIVATKTRPGRNVGRRGRRRNSEIEKTANKQKKQCKSRLYCWIPYRSHLVPGGPGQSGQGPSVMDELPPSSSSFRCPCPPRLGPGHPPSGPSHPTSHPGHPTTSSAVRVHVKGNLEA